jgi:bifunctional non-homologous end joining protein LigD
VIGHLLLPSHNAYKTRLLLEQTRERAVEDAIGLDGQRMRAAPKAPLRKRPTPFPSAVHRSFFCPDCRFAFASFDRYVGACSGALPLPSVTPPASSSLACRPSAKPCRPARNGSTKHDGYRFICRVEGNRIRVFSRRGNDYTDRVPRIVDTLARLPASSVTLDGEGVACDPNGVADFELLRAALGRPAKREVFLYAFDLLELDGRDMRREPWSDRRRKLALLLRGAGHGVQLSDHMEGNDGEAAFRHACAMGLEGIVAKRRDRPYRSGRSPDWIKVKNPDAPAATRLIEG